MAYYSVHIPRCTHIKTNGTQCGSPALRGRRFCFFHKNWRGQRIQLNAKPAPDFSLTLPVLEDPESVQVALMQVMRLILSGQIDTKIAGLLLYALQTAAINLRNTHFEPSHHESVIVDPGSVSENSVGSSNLWHERDFQYEEEEEEPEDEDAGVADEEEHEDNEEAGSEKQEVSESDVSSSPEAHESGFDIKAVAACVGADALVCPAERSSAAFCYTWAGEREKRELLPFRMRRGTNRRRCPYPAAEVVATATGRSRRRHSWESRSCSRRSALRDMRTGIRVPGNRPRRRKCRSCLPS